MNLLKILVITIFGFVAKKVPAQDYLFKTINRTMDLELPESYVGLVNSFKPTEKRVIPLKGEEGANNYVVEILLPVKFSIFEQKKRNLQRNENSYNSFFTYSRLYLDYAFHARVPRGEISSPILPPTNRFGIRYDKMLMVKENGKFLKNRSLSLKRVDEAPEIVNPQSTYSYHNVSFYLHHYSNGQGEGSLLDTSIIRNNYLNGDFSTNFFRTSWGYHKYKPNDYLVSMYLGYQREIGNDKGFLSFRRFQENRYGRNRIMAGAILNKSINLWGFSDQINFRTDIEWILDKKDSLFDYPYENKHRLGLHFFVDLPIKNWKAMGLLFHYYRGRDYLNIRYDDPVQTIQFGVTMKIQRFTVKYNDDESNE